MVSMEALECVKDMNSKGCLTLLFFNGPQASLYTRATEGKFPVRWRRGGREKSSQGKGSIGNVGLACRVSLGNAVSKTVAWFPVSVSLETLKSSNPELSLMETISQISVCSSRVCGWSFVSSVRPCCCSAPTFALFVAVCGYGSSLRSSWSRTCGVTYRPLDKASNIASVSNGVYDGHDNDRFFGSTLGVFVLGLTKLTEDAEASVADC
jgi:hypothetical protein